MIAKALTTEQKVARILAEVNARTAAIAAKQRETENIRGLMDFRMKGWSPQGTFTWLVERSKALSEIESVLREPTDEEGREAIIERMAEAREALLPFLAHNYDCEVLLTLREPCTCGCLATLDALVVAVRAAYEAEHGAKS